MDIRLKRIYEAAEPSDGFRVLVDRLWPRGISQEHAALDLWAKDVAPTAELRRSWHADPQGHDPEHFAAFARDYRAELAEPPGAEVLAELRALAERHDRVTLLYGAKDTETNHAVVLRDALTGQVGSGE